jgi:hypothetical protein
MTNQRNRKPSGRPKPAWLQYEDLARKLLDQIASEFRLKSVDRKQAVKGLRSGTKYIIDAKGITEDGKGFFIVECKHYKKSSKGKTKRIDQGKVSDLAYRILDTRADGAILISPIGFQAGAKKIADAENIVSVQLNQDATPTDFVMQFFNKIRVGITMSAKSSIVAKPRLMRACAKCGKTYPSEEDGSLCGDCR